MLIVPVSGKIGWKNPPVVTLVLLLVNCLVFFLFQIDDDEDRMAAESFYIDSGLAEIEIPRYIDYLSAMGHPVDEQLDIHALDPQVIMDIHLNMESNSQFLRLLKKDRIVTLQDPVYDEWSILRQHYEEKRDQCVAFGYGLRPAYLRAPSFFTYMFLHGGAGHLLGNMVFLWILGCMLEVGSGRLFFMVIYLLSGFLSGGLFCLVYPDSTIPLVGASGAIAGLMGAYTVLYGRKMVTVFYSLGFYFNTATIPAIVLLPAWMANECYQLFLTGVSQVAYVAHIGGLGAGALFAFTGDRMVGVVDKGSFDEEPQDSVSPLLNDALEHLGNLEMKRAQALFEQVLELSPGNREALTHLFNIHKLIPESQAFHEMAKKLLDVLLCHSADYQDALSCYKTYTGLVRRPKLSIPTYLKIAGIMAASGQVDGAEKILLAILKKKPDTASLPSSLMKLAQAFRDCGRLDQWEKYRSLIGEQYPQSAEALIVSKSQMSG